MCIFYARDAFLSSEPPAPHTMSLTGADVIDRCMTSTGKDLATKSCIR